MSNLSQKFINFALQQEVLRFGEFTLKSGRISPYFFNAGLFNTGAALAALGEFYAQLIVDSRIEFDCLFGPAYKGIPLVTSVAIALAKNHNISKPYSFNRKEAKAHGEGGMIVGAELSGNVLVIDDVITAGTAMRECKNIIETQGATLSAIVVALNRQERGQGKLSSIQEIENNWGISVYALANLDNIISHLQKSNMTDFLSKIQAYRHEYGIIA